MSATATMVSQATLPSVEQFMVHRMFDEHNPDGIRFFFNADFVESFLSVPEMEVIPPVFEVTNYSLNAPTYEENILEWLGQSQYFFLAHIYELIRRQKNGERGFLSLHHANVFYVRSDRTVAVQWMPSKKTWWVGSFFVDARDGWLAGDHIAVRRPETIH